MSGTDGANDAQAEQMLHADTKKMLLLSAPVDSPEFVAPPVDEENKISSKKFWVRFFRR